MHCLDGHHTVVGVRCRLLGALGSTFPGLVQDNQDDYRGEQDDRVSYIEPFWGQRRRSVSFADLPTLQLDFSTFGLFTQEDIKREYETASYQLPLLPQ